MREMNPPGNSQAQAHLRDYTRIAWHGRWTLLLVFVLVFGAAAVWTLMATPIYRATASVEVQTQARRLAHGQRRQRHRRGRLGWFAEEKYQNTQVEIIRSRAIAERAFATLSLKNDPRFVNVKDPVGGVSVDDPRRSRRETGLIEVSMRGADPNEAARCVNEIANTFVDGDLERARRMPRRPFDDDHRIS